MMKGLKILILSILIILVTGCSGNYNLVINENLSVKEELDITINNTSDAYQRSLDIFEQNEIPKDNYNVVISDDKVKINYKEEFSSIEDYLLNSKIYHQLFSEIKYNKKDGYIDLSVRENIKLKDNQTLLNGTNLTDLDLIQINVTNPFKVSANNAEIVNDKVYTWSVNGNKKDVDINFKFEYVLDEFPYRTVILISVMILVVIILGVRTLLKYRKTHKF